MRYVFGVIMTVILLTGVVSGCKKYLGKLPDESLSVPSTVQGFRELLDNDLVTLNVTPGLGHLGSDDFSVSTANWMTAELVEQNVYCWAKDIFQGQASLSWNQPYQAIYYCNVVLDNIGMVTPKDPAEQVEANAVRGMAFFCRALLTYYLEESFGAVYRPAVTGGNPDRASGVLLRVSSTPGTQIARSSVAEVYKQILSDCMSALPLLPSAVQMTHRNRPCKPAVYALLSRVYLSMQDYGRSLGFADSCLRMYPVLVDYNVLDTAAARPFAVTGNDEVLFQASAVGYPMQYYYTSEVDSDLYADYDNNDLRKKIFFKITPSGTGHYFKGGYTGKLFLFSGVAVDEVYLDRAECNARMGDVAAAMADLNYLLLHRWRTGTFVPFVAASAYDALMQVLKERRKETLFRECRWIDLRRLNQEPWSAVSLRRKLRDSVYILPPNDLRYVLPIPDAELQLSHIAQNPR